MQVRAAGWLERLGAALALRPRRVIFAVGVMAVAAAVFGGGVRTQLSGGGFEDPGSESSQVARRLAELGVGTPDFVVLLDARSGTVDDAGVTEAAGAVVGALAARPEVVEASSYWSTQLPALRSADGRSGLVLARLTGSDDEAEANSAVLADLVRSLTETGGVGGIQSAVTARIGGSAAINRALTVQSEKDLQLAEAITLPALLLILVLVFGSFRAALLPLVVAGVTVVGTMAVLRVVDGFTDLNVFALNLTTALGLGLSVDYSLFLLSRFREEYARAELGDGGSSEPSLPVVLGRTLATAGRTVAGSAVTVAVSLVSLIAFPLPFLRSLGVAGVAVSLVAASSSLVVVPALAAWGRGRLVRDRPERSSSVESGFWFRLSRLVMARPWLAALGSVVVLVVVGLPFFDARLGMPDDRALPRSAETHQVHEAIRTRFAANEFAALSVLVRSPLTGGAQEALATELSTLPGVARVDGPTGSHIGGRRVAPAGPGQAQRFAGAALTWFSVVPRGEAAGPETFRLVERLRARPLDAATVPVQVGGMGAGALDVRNAISSGTVGALVWIGTCTFALLFLLFGGLLVAVKALALNLLSLSASFGVLVWVFQNGHLGGLGTTVTGTTVATLPVLMFCIAFGLSMDYEVFLLSRIREELDRHGDHRQAVAAGLQRCGRLVTSCAVTIAVVFAAMATSRVALLRFVGVGLALAVVMDATIVRGVLVPAFLRLAGPANWWAPAPLRRLHDRFGFSESGPSSPADRVEPGCRGGPVDLTHTDPDPFFDRVYRPTVTGGIR